MRFSLTHALGPVYVLVIDEPKCMHTCCYITSLKINGTQYSRQNIYKMLQLITTASSVNISKLCDYITIMW